MQGLTYRDFILINLVFGEIFLFQFTCFNLFTDQRLMFSNLIHKTIGVDQSSSIDILPLFLYQLVAAVFVDQYLDLNKGKFCYKIPPFDIRQLTTTRIIIVVVIIDASNCIIGSHCISRSCHVLKRRMIKRRMIMFIFLHQLVLVSNREVFKIRCRSR